MKLYRGSSIKDQKGRKQQSTRKKKESALLGLRKILSAAGICLAKFLCVVIGLGMISLIFVYAYECLLNADYFRLDQITITGLEEEEQEELLASAGLNKESNLLSLNLHELKEIIEKRPWIRRAGLERRLPDRLIIDVEKEQALALVAAGQLYYMNRWGEIFTEVDEAGDLDYPIITGVDLEQRDSQERLSYAVEVLSTLQGEKTPWSLRELSEIHVKENGDISIYFCSLPFQIKCRANELNQKMADLKTLVRHLKDSGRIPMVRGINLDYQDAAVIAMKRG
ncbi:MAG: cell division protein FtsQ/DivIB [Desulfatiglandales bacterium]